MWAKLDDDLSAGSIILSTAWLEKYIMSNHHLQASEMPYVLYNTIVRELVPDPTQLQEVELSAQRPRPTRP